MSKILRFTLVLFIVNLTAASILSGVYCITKPKIDEQEKLVEERALRQVMPETIGGRLEPVEENGEIRYWKVFKGSDRIIRGYVFMAERYGYSSNIQSMVGMKSDGTITGVRIISQKETPGLGAKIVEVASGKTIYKAITQLFSGEKEEKKGISPYFTEQFKGLKLRRMNLSDSGIQAITGATISSKAVMDSIKTKGLEILNAKQ